MRRKKFFIVLVAVGIVSGCSIQHPSPHLATTTPNIVVPQVVNKKIDYAATSTVPVTSIGHITRHASAYLGKNVRMRGYIISQQKGYVFFSDEPRGVVGYYDLAVVGEGINGLQLHQKYEITGNFVNTGLNTSTHNPFYLTLTELPVRVP